MGKKLVTTSADSLGSEYDVRHMERASPDVLVGTLLDERYRIVQHIATGGVGHLYVVEDQRVDGRVKPCFAAKVLRFEHVENDELRARFAREIAATLRVHDPHVVKVIHEGHLKKVVGTFDDRREKVVGTFDRSIPYFVAELLTGMDLADALDFRKWLAPSRAVGIAIQIARGLSAAHTSGVVHRDVKPENVFLVHGAGGRERVKLLDFGLAWIDDDPCEAFSSRLSLSLSAVGTPEYMAPEQALGDIGRPSADIYALGIVLHEMLSGTVPFDGLPHVLTRKHAQDEPPLLDRVSPQLQRVVAQALRKDPSNRYQSVLEMAEQLYATPEGSALLPSIT
jgi:serine/threonine-protein kinase